MILDDFRFAGAPSRALGQLESLRSSGRKREAAWFLVPENFQQVRNAPQLHVFSPAANCRSRVIV